MRARWASLAVGLWLVVAPLALGYPDVAAVLHEVALGTLVAVVALAALEWPVARFGLAVPGLWLLVATRALGWTGGAVRANELAAGVALLLLVLAPGEKVALPREPARIAA